jgi:serine/threonine protein phosphatase PrpC
MVARTWVGRFCVADGHVQEEGPWLSSLIRQRVDDAPDELHVVVEPASPASAEYTAQLVDVIAQLYRKDALSLTGALTRALKAAHEHLLDWNAKSLPEHRIGAGASCIALSGPDAYLAQVGPSLAYVRRGDGTVRRLQADGADFDHSLGVMADFMPRLTRIALEPGDLIVLASSGMDRVIPQSHVERILARHQDDVLPEFYLLLKETQNQALVLLSCFEEEHDTPPDFLTQKGSGEAQGGPLDDQPPTEIDGVLVAVASGDAPPVAHASLAMEPPADNWVLPPLPIKQQVDEIKESAAPLSPPGVAIRGGGSNIRYKKTTGPTIPLPQLQIPRIAVFAALAIALVGFLLWWQLPGSVAENRDERFATALASAREYNARAQAASDPGLKRQLLNDARASLDSATKIRDEDPAVIALRADVTSALSVLNAVYEVKDTSIVVDLAQVVTGDLGVTQIALGGDSTYVLDAEGGRVLRVPVAGGVAETVYLRGREVNNATAGQPLEVVWSASTQSLIVLDDQRQMFTYFPDQGMLPLAVRGVEGLGSLDGIATSGANLYVLDRGENQIWRYLPGQGGYDSERTGLLDGVSLANAIEVAIGEDVYVLDRALGVRRFELKNESTFPLAGIDTPIIAPASLLVLPGTNRIVFADTGNKRIIVATDDGRFIRQIVSPAFTDVRAVVIDEGAGIMYIVNGDTVVRATFPP